MKYIQVEIIARDVTFGEKANLFFNSLLERADGNFVKKYINKTFRTFLINEYPKVTKKTKSLPTDPEWMKKKISQGDDVFMLKDFTSGEKTKFSHYVDYLNTLPKDKDIKISVPDLVQKVKEWDKELRKQSRANAHKIIEDGIEEIKTYPNGFKWVKVFGEKSLKREGKLMKHCVGGYFSRVESGKCSIYSLRDPKNKPHVTIEILSNKYIEQIRGVANTIPGRKYSEFVRDFLEKQFVPHERLNKDDLALMGYIYIGNEFYHMCNLPENVTVPVINLSRYKSHEIKLPKNLTVEGYLNLTNSNITELPENLSVGGDLAIGNTMITRLPNDLKAKSLFGQKVNIQEIGDNVSIDVLSYDKKDNVHNCIFLDGTRPYLLSKIPHRLIKPTIYKTKVSIPKNFQAYELNLIECNIESLPPVKVGKLNLSGSKIKNLPDNLTVEILDISRTKISKLPNNLTVSSNLIANDVNITSLGENIYVQNINDSGNNLIIIDGKLNIVNKIKKGTVINKDVDWYHLKMKTLPKNLTINGDLECPKNLKEIPDGLTCDTLSIFSKIEKIGKNINIKSFRDEEGDSNLVFLPEMLLGDSEIIKEIGNLVFANDAIEYFKNKKVINSSVLILNDNYLPSLPEGLTINGDLDIDGYFDNLPNNLTVNGNINIEKSDIETLPENLVCTGTLTMKYLDDSRLPNNLKLDTLDILEYPKHLEISVNDFKNIETIIIDGSEISEMDCYDYVDDYVDEEDYNED